MNTNDIQKILNDLYTLDPSLRSQEKELTTLIKAMAIKPKAAYDPAFAATLRLQLLEALKHNQTMQSHEKNLTISELLMGSSLRYAFAGIAVIAIAIITTISLHANKTSGPVALNGSNAVITDIGAHAFGTLSAANTTSTTGADTAPQRAAFSSAPMIPATAPASAPAGTTASSPQSAAIMRPIGPQNSTTITYNYTGAPITQDEAQLKVLKKTTTPFSVDQATNALEQAGFGQINLSSFGGLSMSNVTLSQNESFGYQIYLDITNGTISIYENYNEWPQGTTSPLTASQIPTDNTVIATAEQFLATHAISTSTYGAPQVTKNNNVAVPMAATAATNMPMIPYYSDVEEVMYPLMVNNEPVYDTNGNSIGLTVEVNIRYDRVANIYGLSTENYQASAYDAITNTSTILSMAEASHSSPILYYYANGTSDAPATTNNTVTYSLGTPIMGYADIYQSDSNGQSNEFLVPAFIFPVTNASGTGQQNIVVPLIKDFASTNNSGSEIVPTDIRN